MSNIGKNNIQDTRKAPPASSAHRTLQIRQQSLAKLLKPKTRPIVTHNSLPLTSTVAQSQNLPAQATAEVITKKASRTEEQIKAKREAQKKYQQSDKGKLSYKKYQQSDKGKAVKKRYIQSEKGKVTTEKYMQSEIENQPIIPVSDKTILCTNKTNRKVRTHPANVHYNQIINDDYPEYKEKTDKKEKQEFIHGLITQIEGIGLQFIVIADPEAHEGRKLLYSEEYRKVFMSFNTIRRKQNKILHNQSPIPSQTEHDTDNGGGKMSAIKRNRSDSKSS